MRLNEISGEDKLFLTLRGIKFDFAHDYDNVILALSIIGKSTSRRTLLRNDVNDILYDIQTFLHSGIPRMIVT